MRLAHMNWPQAGEYFKKNDIILLAFAGFLESGMVTIAISKDKEENEEDTEEITDGSDEGLND